MTHLEIIEKCMIEYDKAQVTTSYPALTNYEIATILDKAYMSLISQKLTGNNFRRMGFEADNKAIHDLNGLIVTNRKDEISGFNQCDNDVVFDVPTDMLYFLQAKIFGQPTSGLDKISHPSQNVNITSHMIAQNFMCSDHNMPWVKDPVAYIEGDILHVLVDSYKYNRGGNKLDVTYIKKPKKFVDTVTNSDNDPDSPVTPDDKVTRLVIENIRLIRTNPQYLQYNSNQFEALIQYDCVRYENDVEKDRFSYSETVSINLNIDDNSTSTYQSVDYNISIHHQGYNGNGVITFYRSPRPDAEQAPQNVVTYEIKLEDIFSDDIKWGTPTYTAYTTLIASKVVDGNYTGDEYSFIVEHKVNLNYDGRDSSEGFSYECTDQYSGEYGTFDWKHIVNVLPYEEDLPDEGVYVLEQSEIPTFEVPYEQLELDAQIPFEVYYISNGNKTFVKKLYYNVKKTNFGYVQFGEEDHALYTDSVKYNSSTYNQSINLKFNIVVKKAQSAPIETDVDTTQQYYSKLQSSKFKNTDGSKVENNIVDTREDGWYYDFGTVSDGNTNGYFNFVEYVYRSSDDHLMGFGTKRMLVVWGSNTSGTETVNSIRPGLLGQGKTYQYDVDYKVNIITVEDEEESFSLWEDRFEVTDVYCSPSYLRDDESYTSVIVNYYMWTYHPIFNPRPPYKKDEDGVIGNSQVIKTIVIDNVKVDDPDPTKTSPYDIHGNVTVNFEVGSATTVSGSKSKDIEYVVTRIPDSYTVQSATNPLINQYSQYYNEYTPWTEYVEDRKEGKLYITDENGNKRIPGTNEYSSTYYEPYAPNGYGNYNPGLEIWASSNRSEVNTTYDMLKMNGFNLYWKVPQNSFRINKEEPKYFGPKIPNLKYVVFNFDEVNVSGYDKIFQRDKCPIDRSGEWNTLIDGDFILSKDPIQLKVESYDETYPMMYREGNFSFWNMDKLIFKTLSPNVSIIAIQTNAGYAPTDGAFFGTMVLNENKTTGRSNDHSCPGWPSSGTLYTTTCKTHDKLEYYINEEGCVPIQNVTLKGKGGSYNQCNQIVVFYVDDFDVRDIDERTVFIDNYRWIGSNGKYITNVDKLTDTYVVYGSGQESYDVQYFDIDVVSGDKSKLKWIRNSNGRWGRNLYVGHYGNGELITLKCTPNEGSFIGWVVNGKELQNGYNLDGIITNGNQITLTIGESNFVMGVIIK